MQQPESRSRRRFFRPGDLEDDIGLFQGVRSRRSSATDGFADANMGARTRTPASCACPVVAGVYGYGDSRGVVAVIGPRRMDYGNVIGAVRAAQSILNME